MTSSVYSDFARNRPSDLGQRALRYQQRRLLDLFIGRTGAPGSILEIGPGFGAFASLCRERDIPYSFVDNSPAVAEMMLSQGYSGQLGTVETLSGINQSTVWISHVLEHAPTWSDARSMLARVAELAPEGTRIVVIGPDVLSWRAEFFNCDATHGFPTTLRNVSQLIQDVGLRVEYASHHRIGSTNRLIRLAARLMLLVPWESIDLLVPRPRDLGRGGLLYNFKVNFLLRQILVVGLKSNSHQTSQLAKN